MGLYDSIGVWMECPYCGDTHMFDAQTKDLGQMMFCYESLHFFGKNDEKMRKELPVFPSYPLDKANKLWKSQAERMNAEATVPPEFSKLKYIEVTADCHSTRCQFDADRRDILRQGCTSGFGRMFKGKIKIVKGKLVGPIYDIEKDGLTEGKLSRYKQKDMKLFKDLMKKYKHEILAVRHFHIDRKR